MEDLLYILQLTTSAYKEAQSTGVFVIDSDAKLGEAKRTLPAKVYIDNHYLQSKIEAMQNEANANVEELDKLRTFISHERPWWQRLFKSMTLAEQLKQFEHEQEIKRTC